VAIEGARSPFSSFHTDAARLARPADLVRVGAPPATARRVRAF
jgi:hypothetical protein